MKVIQYENEAIVEVGGQKLWFVHSIKLSSLNFVVEDPVQVKEFSISFNCKTKMVIPDDQRESEVVIFSYFCHSVQQTVKIEIEVSAYTIINKHANCHPSIKKYIIL